MYKSLQVWSVRKSCALARICLPVIVTVHLLWRCNNFHRIVALFAEFRHEALGKKRIKDSFTIHHWFILIQLRVLAITLNASRESFNSERNSKRIFRTSHFLLPVSTQIDSLEILENLVTSFGGIWTKSN